MANLPGGNCAPDIMAASVSRIICLDFSWTASGSFLFAASAIWVLRVVISLPGGAGAALARTGIAAAAAMVPPALSKPRRVKFVR
jgi:hypothetical protein